MDINCLIANFMPPDSLNSTSQARTLDRLRKLFFILSTSVCFMGPLTVFSHFVFFPRERVYPTSLVPEEHYIIFILSYGVVGITYLGVLIALFFSLAFFCNLGCNFGILIVPLLHNELRPDKKSYMSLNKLRQPQSFTLFYRSIEILFVLLNEAIRPCIIPLQSLVGQFSLFCNYTLIIYWARLSPVVKIILLFWTTISVVCWATTLRLGGWINVNSKETLKSWKYFEWPKKDKKHLSKFRKSCRQLGFRADGEYGQYCMKKLSVLKFLQGIIKGTFRVLLTLQKQKNRS
jgi:hypothetical protein